MYQDGQIEEDVQSDKGMMMIGLPRGSLLLVEACSKKTGLDLVNSISMALKHYAEKVLDEQARIELGKKLRELT